MKKVTFEKMNLLNLANKRKFSNSLNFSTELSEEKALIMISY